MARFSRSSYSLFDKVDAAFEALDRQGLLARVPYQLGESSCCSGCALSVISCDLEGEPDKKGFVFYHDQDREGGQDDGQMCIRYGAAGETASDDERTAIGNLVAEALRKQGLVVDWDGSPDRAIKVATSRH